MAKTSIPNDISSFSLRTSSHNEEDSGGLKARLGSFKSGNRESIATPHFIGLTSRGVVPHLTQDTMIKNSSIKGVYVAFEDYVGRDPSSSPILAFPVTDRESPLRRFVALQEDSLLVLGPRRLPPVICPANNTDDSVAVLSSYGYGFLAVDDYINAVVQLRPDIALILGDVVLEASVATKSVGSKRKERMVERTFSWTRALMSALDDLIAAGGQSCALFAPVLPVDREMQRHYLSDLYENEDWRSKVKGLVLHETASMEAIPSELSSLPRLLLSNPLTPQAILRSIATGIDLFALPFITTATDAGTALTFRFPVQSRELPRVEKYSLGINMWTASHATCLKPLEPECRCYTCSMHHCAYVHHLLSAKEMLAWVLLQVHNHYVMDEFFGGVRKSIRDGSFELDFKDFEDSYEEALPISSGMGPRIRGYQYHQNIPVKAKKNPAPYQKLAAQLDALTMTEETAAHENPRVEGLGEGEWPIPDITGEELEKVGFGKVDE